MTDLKLVRLLCREVSVWVYSTGPMPAKLNTLWLAWCNDGKVPTRKEISEAKRRG